MDLSISDFTYELPDERIAKFPLKERDMSKLLVYRDGNISSDAFSRLPGYLSQGDLLVFNNTKVIRARIEMKKETGANIEIFCLEPHQPVDYQLSFAQQQICEWKCLVGNLKKWKSGTLVKKIVLAGQTIEFCAERIGGTETYQIIHFEWDGGIDFGTLLDACGHTPIPPYLNREAEAVDEIRYQTVYSKYKGSVAAPTAGLHFTPQVMTQLSDKGVQLDEVTLHVGAGTFRPIQQNDISLHQMHVEFFSIPITVIQSLITNQGIIGAVGTTSLRALESVYWIGVKMLCSNLNIHHLELQQWEPYYLPQDISVNEALTKIYQVMNVNGQHTLYASTQIMIVPGYPFKICKRLITNFHQPKSTLLLLVGAFVGESWRDIYQYALNNDFRFLSYGDSSLLEYHLKIES